MLGLFCIYGPLCGWLWGAYGVRIQPFLIPTNYGGGMKEGIGIA